MSVIINPIEQYFNLDGSPLANGYLYFGVPFGNPVTEPTTVYFDPEFTIPAAQPVRTVNGYPVRSGTATGLFAPDDVSILVQNGAKEQVIYIESSSVSAVQTNTFYRDSNQLLTADDNNKIFIATLPFTQTIDASVALGETWAVQYVNMSNGLIVFDPNLSETIDGQSTVSLQPNQSCYIRCDGINLESTIPVYPSTTIASAATLDLTAIKPKVITVSGTATITDINMLDGDEFTVVASGAFTLTNSSSLIVQGGVSYIASAGDVLTFSKDQSANNVYVQIPRKLSNSRLFDIDASVAANALTITINPFTADFRSTTLTDGTPTSLSLLTAESIVVPSGATLGMSNGIAAKLAVLAFNDGGVIKGAVVNMAGNLQLDETNLLSTTALSSTADSNNVIYSTASITSKAYRVVGTIDISEATAGTWATAPTLVQSAGGQSVVPMSKVYVSPDQTITVAGGLTLAHGLVTIPRLVVAKLKCTTIDNNYAVGDIALMNYGTNEGSGQSAGLAIVVDSVNITVRFGANGIILINKTTGTALNITVGSWRLIIEAYV